MTTDPDIGLWWAKAFGRRCCARLEPGAEGAGPYHGRCELVPHTADTAHRAGTRHGRGEVRDGGADAVSRKDVTDEMVVQAARDYRAARPGPTPFVNELLAQRTGEPLKVCDAAIERALRRGVVECGVSSRTCWPAS